jgi:DNA-directed RNA polymerase subunit RPC12/RpoP
MNQKKDEPKLYTCLRCYDFFREITKDGNCPKCGRKLIFLPEKITGDCFGVIEDNSQSISYCKN